MYALNLIKLEIKYNKKNYTLRLNLKFYIKISKPFLFKKNAFLVEIKKV